MTVPRRAPSYLLDREMNPRSERRESNPHRVLAEPEWKPGALPIGHTRMERVTGIEPAGSTMATWFLTLRRHPQNLRAAEGSRTLNPLLTRQVLCQD